MGVVMYISETIMRTMIAGRLTTYNCYKSAPSHIKSKIWSLQSTGTRRCKHLEKRLGTYQNEGEKVAR